jgi:hypothetical protein
MKKLHYLLFFLLLSMTKVDLIFSQTPIPLAFKINNITLDSFNNIGMTTGPAGCSGNADDRMTFSFTKPAGYTSFNVVMKGSSNFEGVIEVYTATPLVSLACINNASNTGFQTEAQLISGLPTAATNYLVMVYDSRAGGGSNAFSLGVHTSSVSNNVPCASINGSANTGQVAGFPSILSAYDNGTLGGSILDTAANPPVGPNMIYYTGSTAFANYMAGAPLPSCGTPNASAKRVWYSFTAPVISGVEVVLRTNYGATSGSTILEAYSAAAVTCPSSFTPIKCSTNGILRLTSADLASFAGQKIYVQLTENGGTANGIDYLLAIQAIAPSASISSINTNGFTINFPTGISNLSSYVVYYRKQGSSGYNYSEFSSATTSAVISDLESPANYDVWMGYKNTILPGQIFYSTTITPTTLSGCSGSLPSPTAAIAPPPNLTCSKAVVKWPSFANVATSNKYTFYYRQTSSTGFNMLTTNDTFVNLSSLAINTAYEFYYKARCASGTMLTSASTFHTTCIVPTVPMTPIPFQINTTNTDSFNSTGQTGTGWAGCGGGNPDDDLYFSFVKPIGHLTFNVVLEGSSNYDGMFEVGTGTNPTNFVPLACVNNSANSNNQTESKLFTLQPYGATNYYIRVYDYRTGGGTNKFRLGVYTSTTSNPNNIPCNSIDGSSNSAKVAGFPGLQSAFDNGVLGGTILDTTANPPVGPNIVYWTGSTAFASYIGGAPLPTCGTSTINPRRVWHSFEAPSLGGVSVVFRTNYGGTSGPTILEALTAPSVPCPATFSVLKCASNGILSLSAADLAPFAGQKIYIQLSEGGGTANGINYLLAIQGIAPSITANAINTNGFTVNLPTGLANLSKYKVYVRKQGSTGFTVYDLPSTSNTLTLTNLMGNATYEVWAGYYNSVNPNKVYFSPTIAVTTLVGCTGTLPAPTAGIAPSPNTSCTKALVTWPAFAGAGTAYKYRFYYRLTPSTGYYVIALNDTFVNLTGLMLNGNYEFFYKAVCASGTVLSGVSSMYANCGTPKTISIAPYNGTVRINGVVYHQADFRELATATDANIPADNQWHYVSLEGDKDLFKNSINMYPNPSNDFVNIDFEAAVDAETKVELISLDGRVVVTKSINTADGVINPETDKLMINQKINLTETNAGLYLVKITENGNCTTRQLMVIKQ